MTDQDFAAWKLKHATLFRWGDADLGMIDLWRQAFETRGYSVEELTDASLYLAQTAARTWRAEHLQFILDRVAGRRLARVQMERDEEERRHAGEECSVCGGSGIANVPHPWNIHNGEWVHPWYECGVACYCFRGQQVLENNRTTREKAKEKAERNRDTLVPRQVWTFAFYELRNPNWQRQMEAKAAKQKAEREAMAATRRQDQRRGPLVKLLREIARGA